LHDLATNIASTGDVMRGSLNSAFTEISPDSQCTNGFEKYASIGKHSDKWMHARELFI